MFRPLLLASTLLLPTMAFAQSSPRAVQNGPDLEFACASASGAMRSCMPHHTHYKRYMRLANWRYVGSVSGPGTCVLGHTYGYGRDAVWVAGSCQGIFRAPDLRYSDAYNRERLANAYRPPVVVHP